MSLGLGLTQLLLLVLGPPGQRVAILRPDHVQAWLPGSSPEAAHFISDASDSQKASARTFEPHPSTHLSPFYLCPPFIL